MWGTSDESVSGTCLSMRADLKGSGAAPRNLMLSTSLRIGFGLAPREPDRKAYGKQPRVTHHFS
jgi:hypothetical protein